MQVLKARGTMMAGQTAVFLGAGIHTSLGKGIDSNLQALRQAPTPPATYSVKVGGDQLNLPYKLLTGSPAQLSSKKTPETFYRIISDVAEEALTEAGLSQQQRQRMGLYVGSSSFDISISEGLFQQQLAAGETALALGDPSVGKLADYLVQTMGFRGEDFSFNTACTASANALLTATAHVQAGLVEHALVLGFELHNDLTTLGFYGLDLFSRTEMKPFDSSRDGMVLGEGVSALVIGPAPDDGLPRFYLRGGANLSDTFSITTTNPDGTAIAAVMEQALANSAIDTGQINALKVHGTSSLSNDESEALGMQLIFPQLPKLCALKPYLGHTLGACGLNELILFYRAIEAGFLVATPGISATPGDLNVTLNQQRDVMGPGNFMLNYFGFGGNNTSLIISNL
ncbi:MAG TPA: beta-ketoacyl synthase [Porticoccus sp.]|nr:beta-ketoacyl synthase [Porticoccus sp.]